MPNTELKLAQNEKERKNQKTYHMIIKSSVYWIHFFLLMVLCLADFG